MSRIIKEIEIEGKKVIALFDTGAYNSYILKKFVSNSPKVSVKPYRIGLGGRKIQVKEVCIIRGKIEGLDFDIEGIPVDKLGMADGYKLSAIIGALAMEKWEIKLDPKSGVLNLDGLRRREFTEF